MLLVLLLACVVGLFITFLPKQAPQHVTMTPPAPSEPYGYDVPVQPESPWPTFRRDRRNTRRQPAACRIPGDQPWRFQTGKGIFSTPVIDADGLIYFGSADHSFYALNPDGALNWKYETGEIIDSAGSRSTTAGAITFISGDGHMYHFQTGEMPVSERPVWVYEAELRPGGEL